MKSPITTRRATILATTILTATGVHAHQGHADGHHGMWGGMMTASPLGGWLAAFTWVAFLVFLFLGIAYFTKRLVDE